jgi:hypothetical protein
MGDLPAAVGTEGSALWARNRLGSRTLVCTLLPAPRFRRLLVAEVGCETGVLLAVEIRRRLAIVPTYRQ